MQRTDTDVTAVRARPTLTEEGRAALDRAMAAHVAHLRSRVTGPLSVDDRRHLERILRILRDAEGCAPSR
ncbi:hypothetical protein ACSCBZ_17975 [Streptomyces niveiscabiei]|uniref:MarR family transcriptional regulator n=1 Tax=Streptomyces niveiscabiei TaxID=164115 RepID=A0ABW9HJ20_9ACTN|nr:MULTISPECIES: hypothetical protein [Streptomyces]